MVDKKTRKNKKTINIFKPSLKKKRKIYCSPINEKNKYTCFSRESLVKIAKSLNKKIKNKNKKIKFNRKTSIPRLWNAVNRKMKSYCYGEWCWIQQEFVKKLHDKEINHTFRPRTPREWYSNKIEWLSTLDIENVMKQYERLYKDFKFIGPVPIDFDFQYSVGSCIVDELCNININELEERKIKRIGIIFNLDKHNESGSHWVAMYIDLIINEIYYFDSYGQQPPEEVNILAQRIQVQGDINNKDIKFKINKVRHQFKNSECGVYCMYFITELIKGRTFEDVSEQIIFDDEMNEKRGYFYSPSE